MPLSDAAISLLIEFLDTPHGWQHVYTREAKRMCASPPTDPASFIYDFANRAVSIRIQQLRGSERIERTRTKAGWFGLVPLGKLLDGHFKWSTKRFNSIMFETVGLGDISAVEYLYKKAENAASSTWWGKLRSSAQWVGKEWWKHVESAELLQEELTSCMVQEIGLELTTSLMSEAVDIKPAVGQAISVGLAVRNVNNRMIKALEWLITNALEYHLKVFAANALAEAL
jgi:hypothetical protein